MTYVNTLEEREVFAALRGWLMARRFGLRAVFWITGALAFVLSPVLDNLTTALVMGAVALAMGRGEARFIAPACINIVVAANAGRKDEAVEKVQMKPGGERRDVGTPLDRASRHALCC